MTREEAITYLVPLRGDAERDDDSYRTEALNMAIEALKAQDRPIICPRCGRTFAESEGRERDK